MRHVADSSVAVKWVIPEVDSDKAERLMDEAVNGNDELVVPDFFRYEVANVLSRLERRGILQPMEGAQRLADVLNVPMRIEDVSSLLPRAYEISSQTHSSVFDCLYVALAEREGCDFITADARVINNLRGKINVALTDLATLP